MIFYWEFVPLVVGFVLGWILYSSYQFRSGGIISIPLLAIYTVKFPAMLPFMVVASIMTFLILELFFIKFTIYGRRLLYISLSIGMVLMIISVNAVNIDAGWFPLLIPGLIGYNTHRESNSTGKNFLLSTAFNIVYFILVLAVALATIYFI